MQATPLPSSPVRESAPACPCPTSPRGPRETPSGPAPTKASTFWIPPKVGMAQPYTSIPGTPRKFGEPSMTFGRCVSWQPGKWSSISRV